MVQSSNAPTCIVYAGGLGDLFQKKALQALWQVQLEFQERGEAYPYHVIATDVRDLQPEHPTYRSFLEASGHRYTRNHGISGWKEFLDRQFEFLKIGKGVDESVTLFNRIKEFKRAHPASPVVFYLSIPYGSNIPFLQHIRHHLRGVEWSNDIYIVLEKPAQVTVGGVNEIESICVQCAIPMDNVGIVEHFILKHGYKQFLRWAYEDPTHRAVLTSEHLAKVTVRVTEKIGTSGRLYDGIWADSAINHGAALIGSILGNPWDNGFDKLRYSLPPRLKRLYEYTRDSGAKEEVARARYEEFHTKLQMRGAYGVCHEDHCGPDRTVPTALMLRCTPTTNRLNGSTTLEYIHAKNFPTKFTGIQFWFRNGNGSPSVFWEFQIDGEEPETGARTWGFKKSSNALLAADERERRRMIQCHYETVPDRCVDGYPQVFAAVTGFGQPNRRPKMSELLGLDFQRNSINAFAGTAEVLDSTDSRIKFHVGQDAFAGIQERSLLPLKPKFVFG